MGHRECEWEMVQIDADMGMDYQDADADLSQPLHTDSKALRIAIIDGASFTTLFLASRVLPKATSNTFSNLI
jgi:hypothetical protein